MNIPPNQKHQKKSMDPKQQKKNMFSIIRIGFTIMLIVPCTCHHRLLVGFQNWTSSWSQASKEHIPFDSNRIHGGVHCSLYTPSSFPSRIQNGHLPNLKHPKKSIIHSLSYIYVDSCADKSSAGSNHTTAKKNWSCSYDPSVGSRRKSAFDLLSESDPSSSVLYSNSSLKSDPTFFCILNLFIRHHIRES